MNETRFSRFALDAVCASIGSRKLRNDARTCPGTRQRHCAARQHGSQRVWRGARAENVLPASDRGAGHRAVSAGVGGKSVLARRGECVRICPDVRTHIVRLFGDLRR